MPRLPTRGPRLTSKQRARARLAHNKASLQHWQIHSRSLHRACVHARPRLLMLHLSTASALLGIGIRRVQRRPARGENWKVSPHPAQSASRAHARVCVCERLRLLMPRLPTRGLGVLGERAASWRGGGRRRPLKGHPSIAAWDHAGLAEELHRREHRPDIDTTQCRHPDRGGDRPVDPLGQRLARALQLPPP